MLSIFFLLLLAGPMVRAADLTVAAAVSLKESMLALAPEFQKQTGKQIEFLFGSSGQLLAQMKSGAPVDAFVSAAREQVEDLSKAGLIDEESQRIIARNTLVLIVLTDSKVPIARFEDLSQPTVTRVAIGEPKTVPAGRYAQQTLEHLGLFAGLHERLVFGSSVRQVLDYVSRGEASAGIVYATDAKEAGDRAKIIATASEASHEPIVYPAVILKGSAQPVAAAKFLDFLITPPAQNILAAHGFLPPETSATKP